MKAIAGYKKEMTQIFDQNGEVVPCTIIDVSSATVVAKRTKEKDGYQALVIGVGKARKPNKALSGKYKNLGYVPQKVVEIRTEKVFKDEGKGDKLKIGHKIGPELFEIGDKVNVTGVTKGKGFQGVVKRWRFKGGPRTHGQSDRERHGGSIGGGTDPGRVYKGKKMPGHMGAKVKTVENLKVVKVDSKNGIICISGAVPGGRNTILKVVSKHKH